MNLSLLKQIKDAIVAASNDPDPDVRSAANIAMQRLEFDPQRITTAINFISSGTKQQKIDAIVDLYEFLKRSNVKIYF